MAAASVTGQDLRRVLEPREQQVLVMLMRNGDDEHSRRHAAQALRLDIDEVDGLLASARRKVEQLRLRKIAQLEQEAPVVRPVEMALLDAAEHGGNGRAAGEAPTPVGLRSKALARPPRLERDDDGEAKVTTTGERRPPGTWDRIHERAKALIREAGAAGIQQRELADELGIAGPEFSLNLAPRLKQDVEFERVQQTAGKPVTWIVAGTRDERPEEADGFSRECVVAALAEWMVGHGFEVTGADCDRDPELPSVTTVRRHCGTVVDAISEAKRRLTDEDLADLAPPNPGGRPPRWDEQSAIESLAGWCERTGRRLTRDAYDGDDRPVPSRSVVRRLFGDVSGAWERVRGLLPEGWEPERPVAAEESAVAVGGEPPALSSAADADGLADVADRDPSVREARGRLARLMDEEDETSADPVEAGDAERAGVESDGPVFPSRNGGDAPEAAGTAPDAPLSETAPAHTDGEFMPRACAACGELVGAEEAWVSVEGDGRVWHSGCSPWGPPPFAGGAMDTFGPKPPPEVVAALTKMLAARSAQPERSPRERYVDALLPKLDDPGFDVTDVCDRIERQLDALDG